MNLESIIEATGKKSAKNGERCGRLLDQVASIAKGDPDIALIAIGLYQGEESIEHIGACQYNSLGSKLPKEAFMVIDYLNYVINNPDIAIEWALKIAQSDVGEQFLDSIVDNTKE